MEKSQIVILIESVMDGTIDIEQVWQTYGNQIRGFTNVQTEREALSLAGLYFHYGAYLEKEGYLKDAKSYCEESLNILNREKSVVSEPQFNKSRETIIYSLATIHRQLDDYCGGLKCIKQLREINPRKDEYRLAYIGCLGSVIAKYTNPIFIVICILFLLKMGEIYITHTHYIPGWLIDTGWILWIVMLIVQFGLPWILKKTMK